jgi:nucleoside-diphosphate-sugar epimerase
MRACALRLALGTPHTPPSCLGACAPAPPHTQVELLIGSPLKAKRVLGWVPTITFKSLVDDMMKADLAEVDTGIFDPTA